jgi:hypothetical protein
MGLFRWKWNTHSIHKSMFAQFLFETKKRWIKKVNSQRDREIFRKRNETPRSCSSLAPVIRSLVVPEQQWRIKKVQRRLSAAYTETEGVEKLQIYSSLSQVQSSCILCLLLVVIVSNQLWDKLKHFNFLQMKIFILALHVENMEKKKISQRNINLKFETFHNIH